MAILSQIEMQRRLIVLRDRLDETRCIRSLNLKPETAEVGMAVSKGYYAGYPVNVSTVVKRTLMDKQTVMRHAIKLANEPIPLLTIRPIGQDTILRITDECLMDPRTLAYFEFRYKNLVENGEKLKRLLD